MLQRLHIRYLLIKFVVFTILGILVLIYRDNHVEHLRPFIGALMLLYGVDAIVYEIILHRKGFIRASRTYLGLVELIFGVVLLASPLLFQYVCIIWATWSIIRESYEIKEIVVDLKMWIPRILSLTESITVIVFSVLLILNPEQHHSTIHMCLLTAELILNPLVLLIDEFLMDRKMKKAADIDDEDEPPLE